MSTTIKISNLMEKCGVKFGTSGARGLVSDMTDEVCYVYTAGFIQYLEEKGFLSTEDKRIAVAGDLRSSTERIMNAVGKAIADRGYAPVHCGKIPSSAVALYGLQQKIPAIMITGSHIPDDRNGIKYNKPSGEVLKDDELGMMRQEIVLPPIFNDFGSLRESYSIGSIDKSAEQGYIKRWIDVFPSHFLAGKRVGLYEHSAVGRDLLYEIYTLLGAKVHKLGRSKVFIPVDTEAIRPEDTALAASWAASGDYDVILSTDGDSDRPLISDENGKWMRGDVAGILCAEFLGADSVVTPVSCNTAVEKCGAFKEVRRTRIGSPYVIEHMLNAVNDGGKCVIGYEANGGFLTASEIMIDGKPLEALPTRDAVIIHLGILGLSIRRGIPVSGLLEALPKRITASDRIQEFHPEKSKERIASLIEGGKKAIESMLPQFGALSNIDTTDGLRITFQSAEVVHLRPSGNAPELRCYTEADSEERALEINVQVMAVLDGWRHE